MSPLERLPTALLIHNEQFLLSNMSYVKDVLLLAVCVWEYLNCFNIIALA